jgi:hypothetical protein
MMFTINLTLTLGIMLTEVSTIGGAAYAGE